MSKKNRNKKGRGWHNFPSQHAVASKGLSPRKSADIRDKENIRKAIRAELEAISMYEKIAEETDDPRIERLFSHIAEEEKHHLSEFGVGLRYSDGEQLGIDPEGIKEALEEMKGDKLSEDEADELIEKIDETLKKEFKGEKLPSNAVTITDDMFDKIEKMDSTSEHFDDVKHIKDTTEAFKEIEEKDISAFQKEKLKRKYLLYRS